MTDISIDTKPKPAETTAVAVLGAVSFSHLLNDMMQSMLPAIYPILKSSLGLGFGEIGLITLAYQMTASLLQPVVGLAADRRPQPYSLAAGMGFTFAGLLLLSRANGLYMVLAAAAMIGMGSSIFHPEASRVARMASGGKHGLAQSFFQVGGNAGSALGPLLAALIVLPHGQGSVAWVSVFALLGMIVLGRVGGWYSAHVKARAKRAAPVEDTGLNGKQVGIAVGILLLLVFSKYFYLASITSYFTFYLIDKFHVSVATSQLYLFIFLGAVAVGTIVGGPIGDRFGRKQVIWTSILGVLPFTLMMPYAGLFWTGVLSSIIGLILASAFPAIIVYAQELLPGKVGTVAGLFFGFAFGMGGIGAAVLGELADATSIRFVYEVCAFLPAIGLLTVFLPNLRKTTA
ncbi:MAG TPA: MFS transporter [Alphaproteobacteria bacterium]|jgi:FSR family fosmidomycin resistance protein-like MFS transporter|nr:MFS transporter [Alphaproteobacteria bacterium]